MKTRFDQTEYWTTAYGEVTRISEMETGHLMNIVRMFIRKPYLIVSTLISDVESSSGHDSVWTPTPGCESDIKKESLYNITSLTSKQLVDYVFGTPLVCAIKQELTNRGINLVNMIELWMHEDDVQIKEKKDEQS